MNDIFLSYSREDQARAKLFADGFEANGFKVWWDVGLRTGEAYDQVTENALKTAKAVVVLWSRKSVESRWVRAEATLADRNKTLLPCMIEACDRPIMFELTQTAELMHWQDDKADKAWLAFLDDVRRTVGQNAAAAAQPVSDIPAPAPAKPGKRGEAPSIAVLPFANRSGLAEDEVFAFGMVEDLIDALSRGVHARVLSSSSTARFRNGPLPDIDAMGRELGVRYLLEGNVRRSGSDLRVTAQLIEAASGAILWTQKFDRPLTELAALQEQLIEEVAAHLGTQLLRREMEQALRKPGDLTAWECVMRALAELRQYNEETISRAIEESARAVSIAPGYGLAHAVYADFSSMTYLSLSPDDADELRRIQFHIDRALSCDGENAAVLGHVAAALWQTGQATEGLRRAKQSIEINPGHGYAHLSALQSSAILGLHEAALGHFADFRRVEPSSPYQHYSWFWKGMAHVGMGDWAAADAALDCSLALSPEEGNAYLCKAMVVSQLGRTGEAQSLMRKARGLIPTMTLQQAELGYKGVSAASPARETMLGHLRALWAETEPGA